MKTHTIRIVQTLSGLTGLAGFWLIASPFIVAKLDTKTIQLVDVAGGMIIIALSLTNYLYATKTALFARLTALTGLWVVLTPWIFNFSQKQTAVLNNIILGAVVAILAMSSSVSSTGNLRRESAV